MAKCGGKKLRLAETAEINTQEDKMRIQVLICSFSERQRKF